MVVPVPSLRLPFEADHVRLLVEAGRVAEVRPNGARTFLVAAERVGYAQALFPQAPLVPPLSRLEGDPELTAEAAALATVRGWMELVGPTTASELAAEIGLAIGEVEQALYRLESEGQVLRGTFRPQAPGALEWCDRRLLQRIHRQTVGRLRSEIQPLSAQDFMRFLFKWHHLEPNDALRGGGGLLKAVGLLQGVEAPAAAWEQHLLPARMKVYLPELLERACFAGEVAWGRLTLREVPKPPQGARRGALLGVSERTIAPAKLAGSSGPASPGNSPKSPSPPHRVSVPGRNASLTFARREDLEWLLAAARPAAADSAGLPLDLSPAGRDVAEALARRGASFFAELVASSKRLPSEVEDGLWELLARGLVSADAVQNLRVLQSPKARKRQKALQRGGPGRWSLLRPQEPPPQEEVNLRLARLFLRRYGIVWRDLMAREALAPPWRELLFLYRRMEARGEVRGGRFVAGFAGEQFALPEAVEVARATRRAPRTGLVVQLSAVDPLNLTGVVTPAPRVPSVMGQFVTYVDGLPVAAVDPVLEAAVADEAPSGAAVAMP